MGLQNPGERNFTYSAKPSQVANRRLISKTSESLHCLLGYLKLYLSNEFNSFTSQNVFVL